MANPWDCICEFIRAQSSNLADIMNSLGNQNTISDLDTSDTLALNSGVSPLHMFMFLLLMIWGYLYLNGRQRQSASKPTGGSSSSSSGGGGGGSSGDLF